MNTDCTINGAVNSPRATISLSPAKVGMLAFLLSEVAFFSTLITTYVVFLRETKESNPSPHEVFHLPLVLVATACLLASSVTIHFAERAFGSGRRSGFLGWWLMTIVLGTTFLVCTGKEWHELIGIDGLTISRNLFGSTYFTLVGFHALHVTLGLLILSIVFLLGWRRKISEHNPTSVELVSWYWHFVDGVWIVVFSLVYLVGR
jgi:cytochrome c oxidase subunit 3/cytochrome o ubiquinol oxidase subunit 3